MKTRTHKTVFLLVTLIASSFAFGQDEPVVKDIEVKGSESIEVQMVDCRQAYDKHFGKKHDKKVLHKMWTTLKARKAYGKNITKADVERAVDYGYESGAYCKSGRILSSKEFKEQTIVTMGELRAADEKGVQLESLLTGSSNMSCEELIKMPKTKKEDKLNRTVFLLKHDIHNIYDAQEKSEAALEPASKNDERLARARERYLNRVLKASKKELGDDSITREDIEQALADSIEDGSLCSGDKIMTKKRIKAAIIERLSDESQRSPSVSDDTKELESDINMYFNNGGEIIKTNDATLEANNAV